jgi:type IV pilus assembly protein PilC
MLYLEQTQRLASVGRYVRLTGLALSTGRVARSTTGRRLAISMANPQRASDNSKDPIWIWEGKDKTGRPVRGEARAATETIVTSQLRRQGINVVSIKRQRFKKGGKVTDKDIVLFTRQLATMLKAGVPLLQSFEIVARGHSSPAVSRLLLAIKSEIEQGASLAQAFKKQPKYFDALYCNLIQAGEQAGILETVLDRLALYREKMLALKGKIKSALFYPTAVIGVAIIITAVIMVFVIPAFKQVFTSFGADLPAPTLIVMAISDFTVKYWYLLFGGMAGAIFGVMHCVKRVPGVREWVDRVSLKVPIFGELIRKSIIARWTRTLATMFSAGVPLVEALDSVAGAAGNSVYYTATKKIQAEVATGQTLAGSMTAANVFPNMVTQMTSIGEESGALDTMLGKVADFFEAEVDDAVESLSSLMEPLIMAVLGVLIGGMVVAMYLPIFKLGQVV